MSFQDIDIRFDMRTDSNGKDPDSASMTMKAYHQLLWSKQLPNGQMMQLEIDKGCLRWGDIWFGCDSITASFLHARFPLRKYVEEHIPNFSQFKEDYFHKTYTIGGSIIFPMHRWSMNQARGCSVKVCDRWDLTLECIRRFYAGEPTPLDTALMKDREFFNLFVDFKGYVDFFLLQDCVDKDYNVQIALATSPFASMPMPKTLDEYYMWIDSQVDFVEKRGKRMEEYAHLASEKYEGKRV